MQRGRRKTRSGNETRSTFDKTPEVELALLNLQRVYLESARKKPSMRDLLMEGINLLLLREGLPLLPVEMPPMANVIELSTQRRKNSQPG